MKWKTELQQLEDRNNKLLLKGTHKTFAWLPVETRTRWVWLEYVMVTWEYDSCAGISNCGVPVVCTYKEINKGEENGQD